MPEIKRNFTGGKMNKDVDERLIPNGEYRDAMNIQVSTSEGSEVGTVQNILGNTSLSWTNINPADQPNDSALCIGSISDEKNKSLYWLVREGGDVEEGSFDESDILSWTNGLFIRRNMIYKIITDDPTGGTVPVFIDFADIYVRANGGVNPSTGDIPIPTTEGLNKIPVGEEVDIWHNGFLLKKNVLVVDKTYNVGGSPGGYMNVGDVTELPQLVILGNAELAIVVKQGGALNFPLKQDFSGFSQDEIGPVHITAINIVDDMLFWTDGITEPKKINIPRSIEGTNPNGSAQTLLVNPAQNINTGSGIIVEEKHITVVKKAPKNQLNILKTSTPELASGDTLDMNFIFDTTIGAASGNTPVGSTIVVVLNSNNTPVFVPGVGYSSIGLYPEEGDSILLNDSSLSMVSPNNYQVEVKLVNLMYSGLLSAASNYDPTQSPTNTNWLGDITGPEWVFYAEIISINPGVAQSDEPYNWTVKPPFIEKFKNKFPRFSYRYKYSDGEYSSFGPFTNIVFEPGDQFMYHVTDAYNIGMENSISSIRLQDYDISLPKDVVEIDLLYKESNSPTVYLIDTLKPSLPNWPGRPGYKVKGDTIRAVLPENQLLRSYDNVPRSAFAQEITGNRLVYGNYLQNYTHNGLGVTPSFVNRDICDPNFKPLIGKSIKSLRKYSLGISYLDKYGRQTPVFAAATDNVKIPISQSIYRNQLKVTPNGSAPDWAAYYKIFVKETSNEYYNLAMDRVYDAVDGNLWISFPSSDRNKVDEETFLILKKGGSVYSPVLEDNKYKILAIENEAPDFIKTKIQYIAKNAGGVGNTDSIFTDVSAVPLQDFNNVTLSATFWDQVEIPLDDIEDDLMVKFAITIGTTEQKTQYYDVVDFKVKMGTSIPPVPDEYHLTLDKPIEEDWLNTAPTIAATGINETLKILIYKKIIKNSPQFDGRFFVKIARDALTNSTILSEAATSVGTEISVGGTLPFYYLADTNSGVTGNDTSNVGAASDTSSDWNQRLKFGGTVLKSAWFIDSSYYKGSYNAAKLNDSGMFVTDNMSTNDYNLQKTSGFGKGIYQENGKFYIDLSYSYLWNANDDRDAGVSPENYNGKLHINRNDNSALFLQAQIDYINSDYGDSAFYGEMMKFPESSGWDLLKHWRVGSNDNINHLAEKNNVQSFVSGTKFKFSGDTDNTIYTIMEDAVVSYHNNHTDIDSGLDAYQRRVDITSGFLAGGSGYVGTGNQSQSGFLGGDFGDMSDAFAALGHPNNRRVTYKIEISADPLTSSFNPINTTDGADHETVGHIQFIEEDFISIEDQVVSEDPAIWETEPKQDVDLDLYYEIDSTFPTEINSDTNYIFAPIGTKMTLCNDMLVNVTSDPKCVTRTVVGWESNIVEFDADIEYAFPTGSIPSLGRATFQRADGSCVRALLRGIWQPTQIISGPNSADSGSKVYVAPLVSQMPVNLSWFNCYSFGNGVESNRIRDDFNQVTIDKGAKASSILDGEYEEENRKYGLIYSGIYNSNSGMNNLNQFIAAEKITKDINPAYGSIQKLHSQSTADGDLITLCENRVLKILANKDALYNADGNIQLTSTNNVLGKAIPYTGQFGISKNPESFASESYRVYFADKVRGAMIRLSKDGLTAISDHGMKDWFKDHLPKNNHLIGSYDVMQDEYNITLLPNRIAEGQTVSFKEDVRGWVSFKSFTYENSNSCANKYYTFKNASIWRHDNDTRNTFHGNPLVNSSLSVVFNDLPGSVKSFTTLNYEGSNSMVKIFGEDQGTGFISIDDGQYHNLSEKDGWFVSHINTDKEQGGLNEFIEKEGKWFNYIKGKGVNTNSSGTIIDNSLFDAGSLAIQGIGLSSGFSIPITIGGCMDCGTLWESNNPGQFCDGISAAPTLGASNYDPTATYSDGSCVFPVFGCMEPTAGASYNPTATDDDGSCLWKGCTGVPANTFLGAINITSFPAIAYSYVPASGSAISDDGSCIEEKLGCTDPTMFNYEPLANVDDGSCVPYIYGCMEPTASNQASAANTADSSCIWYGCTNTLASNATIFPTVAVNWVGGAGTGIIDDGTCTGGGCMDDGFNTVANDGFDSAYPGYPNTNYDLTATFHVPGDCASSWTGVVFGCMWGHASNYNLLATHHDPFYPSMSAMCIVIGCADPNADNFNCPSNSNYSFANVNVPGNAANATATASSATGPCIGTDQPVWTTMSGSIDAVDVNTADTVYGFPDSCNYPGSPGCTDPVACNHDGAATIDDGTCEYASCAGCMVVSSTNYNMMTWHINPFYNNPMAGTGLSVDPMSPCVASGTNSPMACTIPCGNGGDPAIWSHPNPAFCCDPITSGCTDATYCNYDPLANTDDGSCTNTPCSGCFDCGTEWEGQNPNNYCNDSSFGAGDGSAALTAGASNYDPTATYDCNEDFVTGAMVVDLSCCNYTSVYGCMDPTACNYDPNADQVGNNGDGLVSATNSNNPCLYPITDVTIGGDGYHNPTGTTIVQNGNSPVYYQSQEWDPGSGNTGQQTLLPHKSEYARHYAVGSPGLITYSNYNVGLNFRARGVLHGNYDVGTTAPITGGTITDANTKIKISLQQLVPNLVINQPSPSTFSNINTWGNSSSNSHYKNFIASTVSGWTLGNYPSQSGSANTGYPWGTAQNASNNFYFHPYGSTYNFATNPDGLGNGTLQDPNYFPNTYQNKDGVDVSLGENHTRWYKVNIWQMIDGIQYGATELYNNNQAPFAPSIFPDCGVEIFFNFDIRPCADLTGAGSIGCMDQLSCTYDAAATCHDATLCNYGTSGNWWCEFPGASNPCSPVGCSSLPAGTTEYQSSAACISACGASGPPPPP